MKCEIVRDLLPLYADGLVSDVTRAEIEAHTARCGACRELLEQMSAPVEPEPYDENQTLANGLKRQKRKLRNRTVLACILTALVCVLSWWVYMETHFVMSQSIVVETDGERILRERPELALTAQEKALWESILDFPVIREKMGTGDAVVIPEPEIPGEVNGIIPENAELTEVALLLGANVSVDYRRDDLRIILEYLDVNRDGTVDMIRKTVGVRRSPDTWEADTVYIMEYVIALDQAWYEKTVSEHVWFGFLEMP